MLGRKAHSLDEGHQKIYLALHNGSAMRKFKEMIKAQGVDEVLAEKLCSSGVSPFEVLPLSGFKTEIKADVTGVVSGIDALCCAEVTSNLGAGRTKPGEPVKHDVGIRLWSHVGDVITAGKPWLTVYHTQEKLENDLENKLKNAITIDSISSCSVSTKTRFLHKISSY